VPCLLCVVRVGCRPVAGGAAPRRRWAWSAHPSPRRRRPTWCRSGGTERSPATRSTVGHAKARHASQRMRQPVQVEKGTAAGVGGQPSCRRTPALGAVAGSCGAAIGGLVRLAVSLPRRATAVVLVAGCSRATLAGHSPGSVTAPTGIGARRRRLPYCPPPPPPSTTQVERRRGTGDFIWAVCWPGSVDPAWRGARFYRPFAPPSVRWTGSRRAGRRGTRHERRNIAFLRVARNNGEQGEPSNWRCGLRDGSRCRRVGSGLHCPP
jgi:hypothetical protein